MDILPAINRQRASSPLRHLGNERGDRLGVMRAARRVTTTRVARPGPRRRSWTGRATMTWADRFLHTLKENDVGLVTYVPDNVLTPLISGATADNYFVSVGATREDE